MTAPTSFRIRSALLRQGYTLSAWARARGFAPGTVIKTVNRYSGKNSPQRPYGLQTRQILEALQADTGLVIVRREAA